MATKIEWVRNQDGTQGETWNKEWVEIPGYSEYFVSIDGQIYSTKTKKIMKQMENESGHLYVYLYDGRGNNKKVFVHRALLRGFVGDPQENQECRHLDGNPKNNKLSNLSWGTRQQNIDDKRRHGRMPIPHESEFTKLSPTDIPTIRKLKGCKTSREVGKLFRTSHTTIQKIWRGERWKGY